MAKGTNEYVDEEDGRPYQKPEVDVDAINDEIWLRKKEEEEQQQKEINMSIKVLTAKIKYNYDNLRGSFLEHHSSSWGNPESPTPLELEESIKSEVYSWLNDLGIDVEFKKESEHE